MGSKLMHGAGICGEQTSGHRWPILAMPYTPGPATEGIAPKLILEESCVEVQDGELDGLWTTITIFITLFLLSVCYSATVTFFKVKWIFSSVVDLKQTIVPDYRNMIGQGA
ncbi:hypothetical protein P7K49_018797 [Saguinus oedipus]|uniref:Uncharacterized protein n=1 Tax=Saguinus oedipus TaxID=9490 RepID=A0ABQ9V6S3_SAGOE|nr:hypothetical protein P7K49_018797 [Saguinus oedipus]